MNRLVHHICIQTNSYERSLAFYTELLGFELVKETPDFHGRDYNTWLQLGGFMIELQTPKRFCDFGAYDKNLEGIVHFCLYAADFQQLYEDIKRSGTCRFLQKDKKDIYEVEGGRLFKIEAPERTIIEIRDRVTL